MYDCLFKTYLYLTFTLIEITGICLWHDTEELISILKKKKKKKLKNRTI